MELQHLIYFKKIAELNHVTMASEALHVAQPALSKVVSSLEKEFQVKLFDRVGKNIVLNENGRILLRYTNKILNSLEDVKKELSDMNRDVESTVTISVRAASKLLPSIINGFKKRYPSIRFAIVQHKESAAQNINYDLMIDSTKDKIDSKNVTPVLEEKILLAVPNRHPLASKKKIYLEEAALESFISLQRGTGLSDITLSFCHAAGFEPNIILESDDPATIRELISTGLGIAFLPSITWRGVADSNIKLLSISNMDCRRYINIFLNEERYHSAAVKLFYDYVVNFFRNLA